MDALLLSHVDGAWAAAPLLIVSCSTELFSPTFHLVLGCSHGIRAGCRFGLRRLGSNGEQRLELQ